MGDSCSTKIFTSPVDKVLYARVESFAFNSASRKLIIHGLFNHMTISPGFLQLSQVKVTYVGVLGKEIVTKSLRMLGSWSIGKESIRITATYDKKQLKLQSQ